jgi:adenylylsulfate kinase-like enzyme
MIYWFTGQPGHGKTTLAKRVVDEYNKFGKHVFHIDGDDLRKLTLNQDYSQDGRLKNVKSAQDISLYLHNQGFDVVVSLVSPYEFQRQEFKDFVGDFIREFYVFTTELRGREDYHVKEYTPPIENFVDIDTTNVSIEDSFLIIKPYLRL